MQRRVQLGQFAAHAGETIRAVKKQLITELFTAVVQDTPVLSGTLKGNWRPSKDTPNAAFDQTTADPTNTLATAIEQLVDDKDQKIFLSNGTPYGSMIEYDGHSTHKAPQGMVRINIIRAANKLRTMKV